MNSELKVLFLGTPDFAVTILDKIHSSGYHIVGVVSVPDKPAGRGQKMHESAVTQYAKKNNLYLLQPEKLKAKSFISDLKKLDIDIAIVVAFRMLPEVIWKIPKKGTINLHASLLPQYRGAAPINHAIMNGESETGVTTFYIDNKIDTGSILLQKKVNILPDDNAGSLHDKLMTAGGELILETLRGIGNETLTAVPQMEFGNLKTAPKLFKENCQIDWNLPLDKIHNFIRGLSPYPAAWTIIQNKSEKKTLKIFTTSFQFEEFKKNPGTMITRNHKLGVIHRDGILWLEEVQLEGKRRMKIADFLNGFNLESDAKVLKK